MAVSNPLFYSCLHVSRLVVCNLAYLAFPQYRVSNQGNFCQTNCVAVFPSYDSYLLIHVYSKHLWPDRL